MNVLLINSVLFVNFEYTRMSGQAVSPCQNILHNWSCSATILIERYFTLFIYIPDAEEDILASMSEDDPRCVIHYLNLQNILKSPIILLNDKSYNSLLECKELRTQLGGDNHHVEQCESIPVPDYDPQRHGFHRPCYVKFVKARKISKALCNHVNNNIIKKDSL